MVKADVGVTGEAIPAGYPAEWEFDGLLMNGEAVVVRPIHATDAPTLVDLHAKVTDTYQRHGVATLLLESLVEYARARGIHRFIAEIRAQNAEMLELFAATGLRCTRHNGAATVRVEIDLPIDLAIVAVPASAVPGVIEEAASIGVRAVTIITAGFGETGRSGAAVENELLSVARRHGMRIVGPNCLGVVNTDPEIRMNATFASTSTPSLSARPGRSPLTASSVWPRASPVPARCFPRYVDGRRPDLQRSSAAGTLEVSS